VLVSNKLVQLRSLASPFLVSSPVIFREPVVLFVLVGMVSAVALVARLCRCLGLLALPAVVLVVVVYLVMSRAFAALYLVALAQLKPSLLLAGVNLVIVCLVMVLVDVVD